MRTMVILAVLLSIFLLGTGEAFANPFCSGNLVSEYCYEVTATDIDNPVYTGTFPVEVITCDDGTGVVMTPVASGSLPFWWGWKGLNKQVILNDIPDGCAGYFTFHGRNDDGFSGIGECKVNSTTDRWMLRGHKMGCA